MANKNPEVDKFLDSLNHPLIAEIQAVRDAFLEADPRMTEVVKWSSGRNVKMLSSKLHILKIIEFRYICHL